MGEESLWCYFSCRGNGLACVTRTVAGRVFGIAWLPCGSAGAVYWGGQRRRGPLVHSVLPVVTPGWAPSPAPLFRRVHVFLLTPPHESSFRVALSPSFISRNKPTRQQDMGAAIISLIDGIIGMGRRLAHARADTVCRRIYTGDVLSGI